MLQSTTRDSLVNVTPTKLAILTKSLGNGGKKWQHLERHELQESKDFKEPQRFTNSGA